MMIYENSTREEIQRKIAIIEQKIEEAHQLIPPQLLYRNEDKELKEECLETLVVGEERLEIKRKSYLNSEVMKRRFNKPKRNQHQQIEGVEERIAIQSNEIRECTAKVLSDMNTQKNQKQAKGKHLERQPSFRNLIEKYPYADRFKALYSKTTRIQAHVNTIPKKPESPLDTHMEMVLSPTAQNTKYSPMNVEEVFSPSSFPISPTCLPKQTSSSETTAAPLESSSTTTHSSKDTHFSNMEEGLGIFQKYREDNTDSLSSQHVEQMHTFSLLLSNLESFDENTRNDFCIFLRTLSLLNETQNSTILWNLIEKVIMGLLSESDIQMIDQLQDVDFEKLIDTVNTEYRLIEMKKNYQTQVDSLKRKLEETENNPVPKRRKLEEDKSIEENEEKTNAKLQNLPKWKILQMNSAKEAQERLQQENLIKSQKINEIIQKSIQKDDQLPTPNLHKVSQEQQQDEELKKKLAQLNDESIDLTNKLQQTEEDCEMLKNRIMLLEKLKEKKALEKKALLIKKRRIAEENDCVSSRRRAMKEERERIDKNLS